MIKKLLCTLLSILILIPAFGYFDNEKVFADGSYEVAYIEDDGKFTTVATYSDFGSAKNKMKENADYVVRHGNSNSPSKIIAMNSGFVYSYPYRRGYSTMNLYETVNSSLVGTGATTYVAEHYEMTYHSTYYYYESKGYGYVEVTLNGFHGYCDLEYTDLVPTKFIEKGIPITLGGGDKTGSNEQPFSVKIKQNYYYVNEKNGYRDLVFVYHRAWSKTSGGDCLEYSSTIGVAPEFMNAGTKYYSNDGINFYTDSKLTNLAGTYYNYYQFLPLRTKTNISADTMNSFVKANSKDDSVIRGQGQSFINAQNNYGCNASSILAMAIHESGWGSSNIAKGKYNLFGWGAFDDATSNATRYSSVEACVNAQMADNLANYMDVKCSRYFSMSLGNKGGGFIVKYASDPYWAEKIASHYYALDKYSGGNTNGKLTDYNTYNLALVKTKNAAVRNVPNGNVLYTVANKSGYQKNLIVVTLGEQDGYTKTQASQPIDNGSVIFPIELPSGTLVDYDYSDSVVYIKTSDLTPLRSVDAPEETGDVVLPEDIVDPNLINTMSSIDEIVLNDNSSAISICGTGFMKGVNFNDASKVKHELVFKNIYDNDEEYVYLLNTTKNTLDLNDGYKYDYVSYNGTLNSNDIPFGSYLVYLRITNGNVTKDSILKNSNSNFSNIVSNSNGNALRIYSNKPYSYRIQFEKLNTPINLKAINKKRNTPSVFGYESIEIDDDLHLNVSATAYIPGVNFDSTNTPTFKAYLVKNSEDYKVINGTIIESPFDYTSVLKTSYLLNKVTFEFSQDLKELEGQYDLICEITSNDGGIKYIDYVYMNNNANLAMPSKEFDNKEYKMIETTDKNKTMIICGQEIENEDDK